MNSQGDCDDQQRWIDDLLRAGVNENAVSPPDMLRESFRTAVARQRQHARLLAGGLATAATLLIAAGWTVLRTSHNTADTEHNVAISHDEMPSPAVTNSQADKLQATFVSNGDTIAVPVESASADVTIVQLYPTTDTEQRWRRELSLTSIHSDSNGG